MTCHWLESFVFVIVKFVLLCFRMPDKMFSSSPKAQEMREAAAHLDLASKSTATLMQHPHRQQSIITLSSRSNATSPSPDSNKLSGPSDSPSKLSPQRKPADDKTIINSKTRNIAAKAAERRNKAQINAYNTDKLYLHDKYGHTDTADNYLTPSRLATHDKKYGSTLTLHLMDTDAYSTGTADQNVFNDGMATRRRLLYRPTKKSQAAANRNAKKRTRSHDQANYQQVSVHQHCHQCFISCKGFKICF